jgi:hypothetical protein
MAEENMWRERIKVRGDALRDKVKELLHEGNVRRIVVRNSEGQTVMELPLTFGVLGAAAAPMLTAVGAISALAAHWKLEVERRETLKRAKKAPSKKPSKSAVA